jgi:molecular chaperone DnaK
MGRKAIGIDFGTAFCRAAIAKDGATEIISTRYSEGGAARVPEYIKKLASFPPTRLLTGAYAFSSIKQKIGLEETVQVGKESVSVPNVAAQIFRALKEDAESYLPDEVYGTVVTVPSCFSDKQRNAIRQAAEEGGFETVKLLDESVAAVLASGVKEEGKVILVYALGAGVFTASLIQIVNGAPSALWHEGEKVLGGNNFDELLVRHLFEKLQLDTVPVPIAKLKRIAEKAKIELTKRDTTDLDASIRDLYPANSLPEDFKLTLARSDFEAMIAAHIDKTILLMEKAIEKASLSADKIGSILLIGGSTKIPLIERRVQEKFTQKIQRGSDALIVNGAAIFSAQTLSPVQKAVKPPPPREPETPASKAAHAIVENKTPPRAETSWLSTFEPTLTEAHLAWEKGAHEQAIATLEEHQRQVTKFIAHLYFSRGELAMTIENYQLAIDNFQKGLQYDDDLQRIQKKYHVACNRYARQLYQKGHYHEARSIIKTGIDLDVNCEHCRELRNLIEIAISRKQPLARLPRKGKRR